MKISFYSLFLPYYGNYCVLIVRKRDGKKFFVAVKSFFEALKSFFIKFGRKRGKK